MYASDSWAVQEPHRHTHRTLTRSRRARPRQDSPAAWWGYPNMEHLMTLLDLAEEFDLAHIFTD